MSATKINYIDACWSPWVGCSPPNNPAAVGCAHCWATSLHNMRHKAKLAGKKLPQMYETPFRTVKAFEDRLRQPLHAKKPRRIGVCFQSDFYHELISDYWRKRAFLVMNECPRHQFVIPTKRPDRAASYFADGTNPPSNVIHLFSAANQAALDWGMPHFLRVPGRLGLSIEPLVGPIDLLNADGDRFRGGMGMVQLVIIGGESGHKARPCDIGWIRSIVKQCEAAGVACWVKQLGSRAFTAGDVSEETWDTLLRLKDRSGSDMDEWPIDLRVRQWPEGGK